MAAPKGFIYRTYEEASSYAKSCGIKTYAEWLDFCGNRGRFKGKQIRPRDIPAMPNIKYKKKWQGWGVFLGTNNVSNRKKTFTTYKEARAIVQRLKVESVGEWRKICKKGLKPKSIPSSPNEYYKGRGWISWKEFLCKDIMTFEEARQFARNLSLSSKTFQGWREFAATSERPKNLPFHPERYYRGQGWVSWSDFLGGQRKGRRKTYKEAKRYARGLQLRDYVEWGERYQAGLLEPSVPYDPSSVYKKEWQGWEVFLGTGDKYRVWSYRKSGDYLSQIGIKSATELGFVRRCLNAKEKGKDVKKIVEKMLEPNKTTGKPRLSKAKVNLLLKVTSIPENIPDDPYHFYKNKGKWKNWKDFLNIPLKKGEPKSLAD